jgi:hypothetical protein
VTLHVIWSWISTWEERREELQADVEMELVEYELSKNNPGLADLPKQVSLPAPFPFTVFFHTWLKKLCFHPERYISFLVKIMQRYKKKKKHTEMFLKLTVCCFSIDQKFLITDTVLYDFEGFVLLWISLFVLTLLDPSSNLYMVIKGNVTLRLGRTRTGKERCV